MILKCKRCGHEMTLIGNPTHIEWICEKCFTINNNYDEDLRNIGITYVKRETIKRRCK